MESLPPEILLQIALENKETWMKMFVVRQFAEMGTRSRFVRIARRKFGLSLPWKKHYKMWTNVDELDDVPRPVFPAGIVHETLDAYFNVGEKDVDGPFAVSEFYGRRSCNLLNVAFRVCSKVRETNKHVVEEECFDYQAYVAPKIPGGWKFICVAFDEISTRVHVHETGEGSGYEQEDFTMAYFPEDKHFSVTYYGRDCVTLGCNLSLARAN